MTLNLDFHAFESGNFLPVTSYFRFNLGALYYVCMKCVYSVGTDDIA